jgi:acyl carrier protein
MTPISGPIADRALTDAAILEVVLGAMRTLNLARDAASQLVVAPDASVFGPGSPLDSLGLLNLLLDIEEDLQRAGCHVVLSDDRAMSQKRSPFRSVASLVEYIGQVSRG